MRTKFIAFVLVVLATGLVRGADPLPAAGSLPTDISNATHGWVVLPPDDNAKPLLVHLPPRGSGRAEPGIVHPALVLDQQPERLAAWNDRVYMIEPASASYSGGLARPLRSIAVAPGVMGSWVVGDQNRLITHPSLPGDEDLIGFVAVETGPIALTRGKSRRLWILAGTDWVQLRLPETGPMSRTLRLVPMPTGLGMVEIAEKETTLWTVESDALRRAGAADSAEPQSVEWRSTTLAWPEGSPIPGAEFAWVAGDLIWITKSDNVIDIWSADISHALHLARIDSNADRYAFVPLVGAGRVGVLLRSAPDDEDDESKLRLVEVSTFSGNVIYDGQAKQTGAANGHEMRLLMAFLAAMMVIVLLVVLRSDNEPPIVLPERVALAPGGIRVAAGVIDLVIVAVFVAIIRAKSPIEMLNFVSLLDPGREADLILIVGVGFAMSVFAESLFGRTIGKAIVGCRVISVGSPPEDKRPNLWQSMIRNAVRWLLPPVALIGLLDPEGRHRGDGVARTVVVVDIEPPE